MLNDLILRNLHSNMVRFIINGNTHISLQHGRIYIPIWLDLLLYSLAHNSSAAYTFTFQYG